MLEPPKFVVDAGIEKSFREIELHVLDIENDKQRKYFFLLANNFQQIGKLVAIASLLCFVNENRQAINVLEKMIIFFVHL